MSATFSINIGDITESASMELSSFLDGIVNNSEKLIKPKHVRDAFFSTWSNSVFKVNKTLDGTEYIGIDSSNPENRDVKKKILLGKRKFGNLDLMTNTLMTSDTDIFIYNTKQDNENQSSTKI